MSGYFRGLGPDKRPSTPESRRPKLAVNRTNKFFRKQPKSNFRVGETTLLSHGIPALAFEMRVTRQRGRRSSRSRKMGCTGQYASDPMGVGSVIKGGTGTASMNFDPLCISTLPLAISALFRHYRLPGSRPQGKCLSYSCIAEQGGVGFISAPWQSWVCLEVPKCVFVLFLPR